MAQALTHYQKIWQVVQTIPAGRVATYGQVADLAGLPGRARLTGKALGKVPSDITVPWYRVLRSSGQIAFPKGSDLATRQCGLLQEENVVVLNNRVRLKDFQWQPSMEDILYRLTF